MNDIIKLLDLEDEDIKFLDIAVEGSSKIVTLEKKLEEQFCPLCGFKMHSKGISIRTVKHQVIQDGYKLILKLRQRRWLCTNPDCRYAKNDEYSFVDKSKQTTNANDLIALNALMDPDKTFTDVARMLNISDHQVINIFEKHVKMKRLPLSSVVSVDEVYLDMDTRCKYVLVIQDFSTGDAIDLVKSRQDKDTEPYFASIPIEERLRVNYLISDMYHPYISYVDKYFPRAMSVVDSFHVMQWLLRKIDSFLRSLLKHYREIDKRKAEEKAKSLNRTEIYIHTSDEVYLLEHCKWVVLKNQNNIDYSPVTHWNGHFRYYITTDQLEEKFLKIHKDLPRIRDLKEEYIAFNSRNAGYPVRAARELDELIELYQNEPIEIFTSFATTLKRYKGPIINSFVLQEKEIRGEVRLSRLSNGPMESLNRKAKDLKRLSRGYTNFDHLRNRFLYTTRKKPSVEG